MVTTTDSTDIVTQAKIIEQHQPSFKRWLKHVCHIPSAKRFYSKQDQHAIAQAVAEAEHGHVGEIQVVIEACLPAAIAYQHDTLARARQLFAELGTWDTEYNSGVLLYLNLCERKVEIVIDRGIRNATTQEIWDEICQNIIQHLVQQKFKEGVIEGVKQIGEVLDQYYDRKIDDLKNELGNKPIILG